MDRLLTLDQIRVICVSLFSSTLAYLTPTQGFLIALAVMFAFNIWCGMRADGVSIIRCKNFKWSKFKNALAELLLYLVIIEVVFVFMDSIGDGESALIVIKTITYVFFLTVVIVLLVAGLFKVNDSLNGLISMFGNVLKLLAL